MASIIFPLVVFMLGLLMYVACSEETLRMRATRIGFAFLVIGAAVLTLHYTNHWSKL